MPLNRPCYRFTITLSLRRGLVQDPESEVFATRGAARFVKFDMGDWKADKEETLKGEDDDFGGGLSHKFFLWIVPQRSAR
jgi:hypothetical protein